MPPDFWELSGFLSKPSWSLISLGRPQRGCPSLCINSGPALPYQSLSLPWLLLLPDHNTILPGRFSASALPALTLQGLSDQFYTYPSPQEASSDKPPAPQNALSLGPVSLDDTLPCVLPKNCFQVASWHASRLPT